jgi:DNA-directed RNA polymerase subunit F
LTDAEAQKFWPIFDRYQKAREPNADRLVALIEDYSTNFKTLSDEKAMKLVDEYLSVEADQIKVKREYVAELAKVLPGRKVARFFQIENKMGAGP